MKTTPAETPKGRGPGAETSSVRRLAALERLIAYARDEAENLRSDVLVFCLDASLSVVRTELEDTALPPEARLRAAEPKRNDVSH